MDVSGLWLAGLLWSVFLGMAVGNFATNPIYRLPRNDKIFGRKPYCGDCNAELKPRDLFPVFSWLSTGGKCRYCGASVPAQYVLVEALVTVWFTALYIRFGFSEPFVLLSLAGTALVMLFAMEMIDRFFSHATWISFLVLGMIYRTLQDGTIFDFLQGVLYCTIFAMAFWKWNNKRADIASGLPDYVKLFIASGVWFGLYDWGVWFCLVAVTITLFWIVSKTVYSRASGWPLSLAFTPAWMVVAAQLY
jgi:prepilin signal peptidase PulO-like enzyme (type II secretory pathway)